MQRRSGQKEKRDFCRLSVDVELSFTSSDGEHEFKGKCINLSHSGILFDTEHSLTVGQSLHVSIDTKSTKFQPMSATIEVVRVEVTPENNNRIAGKILEFT